MSHLTYVSASYRTFRPGNRRQIRLWASIPWVDIRYPSSSKEFCLPLLLLPLPSSSPSLPLSIVPFPLFPPSFPPVPGSDQNWMEVAYGTQAGAVRVVVRHPENIGQAPQIFQSYSVHTCPIMRVVLGERHLISGQSACPHYFFFFFEGGRVGICAGCDRTPGDIPR